MTTATAEPQTEQRTAATPQQQLPQQPQPNNTSLRKREIIAAVSTMIDEHDRWAADPDAPEVPTQRMEFAIDAAILECSHGDVPGDCRQLVAAMELLAGEWSLYKSGKWGAGQRPLESFWNAFRSVMTARQGATRAVRKSIEPVAELIRQKVSHQQIALIYGGERGPFMVEGSIQVALILQEAKEPHSVVPADWVHPNEIEREQQELDDLKGRLAAMQEQPQHSTGSSTVEQMLRSGANVQQIAMVKKISDNEVRAIAAGLGIEPVELESLTGSVRSPYDREIQEEQDTALQAQVNNPMVASRASREIQDWPEEVGGDAMGFDMDTSDATDGAERSNADGESTHADGDDAALRSLIIEAHERNGDLGAPELASLLTAELESPVSPQTVAEVLRAGKNADGAKP